MIAITATVISLESNLEETQSMLRRRLPSDFVNNRPVAEFSIYSPTQSVQSCKQRISPDLVNVDHTSVRAPTDNSDLEEGSDVGTAATREVDHSLNKIAAAGNLGRAIPCFRRAQNIRITNRG